jgi:hypothetical protein
VNHALINAWVYMSPCSFEFPESIPSGGSGNSPMQKQCVDHSSYCKTWGRSKCTAPGVADRCPCMCTGTCPNL